MTAPSNADRSFAASRQLIDNEAQSLAGVWEYRVVEVTPLGLSGTPTAPGMPNITNAPGGPTNPLALLPGTLVYVVFVNNDPGRAMVLSVTLTQEIITASLMVAGSFPVAVTTPPIIPIGTGTPQ